MTKQQFYKSQYAVLTEKLGYKVTAKNITPEDKEKLEKLYEGHLKALEKANQPAPEKASEEAPKRGRNKTKKDKPEATSEAPEKPEKASAGTTPDATIECKYKLREKSLQPTKEQLELIKAIPDTWEIMVWKCNKNMVTCYYDNVQAIEVMTGKKRRVSTKPAYKTTEMTTRNSGYGMDATIQIDNIQPVIKKLVSTIEKDLKAKKEAKAKKPAPEAKKSEAKKDDKKPAPEAKKNK